MIHLPFPLQPIKLLVPPTSQLLGIETREIVPLPKRQHLRIGDQRGRPVRNARVLVQLGQRSLEQLLRPLEHLLPLVRAPGPGRRDIGGWREAQEGNGSPVASGGVIGEGLSTRKTRPKGV